MRRGPGAWHLPGVRSLTGEQIISQIADQHDQWRTRLLAHRDWPEEEIEGVWCWLCRERCGYANYDVDQLFLWWFHRRTNQLVPWPVALCGWCVQPIRRLDRAWKAMEQRKRRSVR